MYEIIGYAASVLIAVSLMMSSIIKLRILNLSGAFTFTVYGYLIGSMPVLLLNALIVGINIYYLFVILSAKEYFKLLGIDPGSEYLRHFLKFYENEIKKFNPAFEYIQTEKQKIYFMLRNLIPAGLFIVEIIEEGVAEVKLDFVIPGYRDFKTGKFIFYKKRNIFTDNGITKIITRAGTERHRQYLQKMGFEKTGRSEGAEWYALTLG